MYILSSGDLLFEVFLRVGQSVVLSMDTLEQKPYRHRNQEGVIGDRMALGSSQGNGVTAISTRCCQHRVLQDRPSLPLEWRIHMFRFEVDGKWKILRVLCFCGIKFKRNKQKSFGRHKDDLKLHFFCGSIGHRKFVENTWETSWKKCHGYNRHLRHLRKLFKNIFE